MFFFFFKLFSGVNEPIQEMSPTKEQEESISKLCQQLSQGLTALSKDDPFSSFQSSQSNHTSPAFQKTPQPNTPHTGKSFSHVGCYQSNSS